MPKLIQYFDGESGHPTCSMTMDQARECSHAGPVDAEVAANLDKVTWHATDDQIRKYLKGYGAWSDLLTAGRETLRSRMLWVAACDIAENPDIYG